MPRPNDQYAQRMWGDAVLQLPAIPKGEQTFTVDQLVDAMYDAARGGFFAGVKDGYEEGFNDGYIDGYDQGYEDAEV